MTITVNVPPEMEGQLQKAARMHGTDVATFLLETVRQQLRPDVLSEAETELFLRLQNLFPPQQTRDYQALCERSDAGGLTEPDRQRFLSLLEQRDHQNAERLEIVAELARIRGVSLREMMTILGIKPE